MLFDLHGRDGAKIKALMENFKATGQLVLGDDALAKARELFSSYRLSDEETISVIREVFETTEYLLDPHTAIGVQAARKTRQSNAVPMICLATAHPAKFPEAVQKAGQSEDPKLPHHMQDLFSREERYQVIEKDIAKVQDFIRSNI